MSKRNLFLLLSLGICNLLFGDTIYVKKLNVSPAIALQMPVMMNETNLKGDKFQEKNLLATEIKLPCFSDYNNILDTFGDQFELPKAEHEYQVQFLSFMLTSDRYAKASVMITTPDMIELYVDGMKEGSKDVKENEISKAKKLIKEITLLPYQAKEVVIKYLSTSHRGQDNMMKIAVFPSSKDSLAVLSFSNNGKRRTNIQDDLQGVRATSTKTSPNGQFAFIKYNDVDSKGKKTTYTELKNLKTSATIPLYNNIKGWMPKTNRFYYLKSQLGNLYLTAVDPENLEEYTLASKVPNGQFTFSPDETFLIYSDNEDFDTQKGDFKLLKSPDDRIPRYMDRSFLYKYDLKTGVKMRLTFGQLSTSLNDISADSRYILYSTTKETITEHPFRTSSMYMLNLQDLKIDTLWHDEKFVFSAKFSPNMKELVVTGAPEAFGGVGLNIKDGQIANSYDVQAYIYNLETKEVKAITKNFNPSVNNVWWNENDQLIYLSVVDKDCENIYTYDKQKDNFTKLNLPADVISSFSIAQNSSVATFIGRSIDHPTQVFEYNLKNKSIKLISDPMGKMLANRTLGEVKNWCFTSSDSTSIEGFYHLPPNFDPSKKYPLIVYYYGGTSPTSRTFEHPYSMHNFASLGYVVYTIQPSGAIGYGQEFSARHVNAWGKRTAEDIIEGTKEFVKQHPFIDQSKIGCVGASYGGFMTMYLQTQTDLFAAAISHAGISSLSSYWGEGFWGYSYSAGASALSYPWNNQELYVNQSPLFHADKIKTPILLTHGTVDTNVPMGESIQMFTALKILGAPVEFLQVKDENHGIMQYERRIQWSYSMYAWFDKWLKNQPEWWNNLYPGDKN